METEGKKREGRGKVTICGSMSVEVSDLDVDVDILGEGECDGENGVEVPAGNSASIERTLT